MNIEYDLKLKNKEHKVVILIKKGLKYILCEEEFYGEIFYSLDKSDDLVLFDINRDFTFFKRKKVEIDDEEVYCARSVNIIYLNKEYNSVEEFLKECEMEGIEYTKIINPSSLVWSEDLSKVPIESFKYRNDIVLLASKIRYYYMEIYCYGTQYRLKTFNFDLNYPKFIPVTDREKSFHTKEEAYAFLDHLKGKGKLKFYGKINDIDFICSLNLSLNFMLSYKNLLINNKMDVANKLVEYHNFVPDFKKLDSNSIFNKNTANACILNKQVDIEATCNMEDMTLVVDINDIQEEATICRELDVMGFLLDEDENVITELGKGTIDETKLSFKLIDFLGEKVYIRVTYWIEKNLNAYKFDITPITKQTIDFNSLSSLNNNSNTNNNDSPDVLFSIFDNNLNITRTDSTRDDTQIDLRPFINNNESFGLEEN